MVSFCFKSKFKASEAVIEGRVSKNWCDDVEESKDNNRGPHNRISAFSRFKHLAPGAAQASWGLNLSVDHRAAIC